MDEYVHVEISSDPPPLITISLPTSCTLSMTPAEAVVTKARGRMHLHKATQVRITISFSRLPDPRQPKLNSMQPPTLKTALYVIANNTRYTLRIDAGGPPPPAAEICS